MILGPTASGKTELALHLAAAFGGEIVSCDSVQVYRGFDIGSAKTTPEERRGIPHHLIDVAAPDQVFTAGDYARLARQTLAEISARENLPIVVGGTGFYLRALLHGLFQGPERDGALRANLVSREHRRPGSLHRILRRVDAASAARIHPHDVNKTIRAIEVCLLARQPMSVLFGQGRDELRGFDAIKIGLDPPRPDLYTRIDQRLARMFDRGLLDEVAHLLASGIDATAKPFESLGYKQALQVIRGELAIEDAVASAAMETRRYAKRQMTWFRREIAVRWIGGFGDCPEVQRELFEFVQQRLRLS